MRKKKLWIPILLSALVLNGTMPTLAAQANTPFSDVPADHWSRAAVAELVHDGIISGYDDHTFRGDQHITRYEMAQLVARAMSSQKALTSDEKNSLQKLNTEYAEELESLGMRVSALETKTANLSDFKISGVFIQKYMKDYKEDSRFNGGKDAPWWERYLELNMQAPVKNTDWKFNTQIVSKAGSKDKAFSEKFDAVADPNDPSEEGGKKEFHPERMWVEGNLGGTGQYAKLGFFQPWVQNGFISDARIKGASLEHWGQKSATHIYAGNISEKYWDLGAGARVTSTEGADPVTGTWTKTYTEDTTGGVYSDFVRHHDTINYKTTGVGSDWNFHGDDGSDNKDIGYNTYNSEESDKHIFAFVYDYKFSPKYDGSVGYYNYKSYAYNGDALQIGAVNLNVHLNPSLTLANSYSHGNQDGYDKAYNIELQYNGNPWIDSTKPHNFGAYLAYRYLGPDAIIKPNYSDGIKAGQKGFEVGTYYTLTSNILATLKYATGKSIYYGQDRSRVFTSLQYAF